MARIYLSDYTLAELKGLLFEVATAIRTREREQVAAARAKAQEIARAVGLSLDDIEPTRTRRTS